MARPIKLGDVSDMWTEERAAAVRGMRTVAGIDEAGRGALAGPVVAACVVLPLDWPADDIHDSKVLTPAQREAAFERIVRGARGLGVGIVEAARIDACNVLRATHEAMRAAAAALPRGLRPDLVRIDGLPVQPFPIDQIALVGGDGRSKSIAAASIVAKVTRDRIMVEHDATYPGYSFASHKGYGCPEHLRSLAARGPCSVHRMTFRPVAEAAGRK